MLVLSRKPGEALTVGADVTIRVLAIQGNQVRIGIEAPLATNVVREELLARLLPVVGSVSLPILPQAAPDEADRLMSVELAPFVLYRLTSGQLECAFWRLREGPLALALFQTEERATAYQKVSQLGADWKVFRPDRTALGEVLRGVQAASVQHAVLDPDGEKATLIFSIADVLAAVSPG